MPIQKKKRVISYDNNRRTKLKQRYGITTETYDQMLAKQKHKCKICGDKQKLPLFIDHCHLTKKVRGLLCNKCNTAIAYFKESIKIINSAINYIKKSRRR